MDSNSEDGEYQHLEHYLQQDAAQYRVTYPRGRDTQDMDSDQKEEFNIKKYPVSRSGNNPGRVKRVVSCKRKTHHLTVTRRKQLGIGKMYDAANKENEMKCMPDMDSCEFPLKNNNNPKTGTTGTEQADYCSLTELTRDHSTMTDVLFGRNLRLKVSLTLWRRNVGELLTYFLRIEDIAVFVDFLPLISKSIDEDSTRVTIGGCVDLFPLVRKVLTNPYEEYLIVGLKWIHSVLKNWWGDLETSGYSGSTKHPMDKNFQAFNQQLAELWHQEPFLKSVPGPAGDLAKVIDSFLSQLT
ncbi:KATNB1-like protein 1 isoform X1 [Cyclopterus lumpus]|uniref:Katanin p80 subunit C-terminal domain-containing protein n=1 Tax=Cyclopterus lumpus TaxID=8103 RepID=A0A8C2XLR9_CYCLU|nr:KATNB1-like protein 1 isoform X1 [Cyclopterus lumpus]